jgi:hypothetical protein
MSDLWVAIDVGCHECGVTSEVIGAFRDEASAEEAAEVRGEETGCWRDGGQSIPEVFRVKIPAVEGSDQ